MQSIKTVCVCGAGTMGSGIAQVCAQAGFVTIQFDIDEAMLAKSKASIDKGLSYLVNKGKLDKQQSNVILNSITFTNDINLCKADIIIEAIVEEAHAKADLFNRLTTINNQQTIFATNTSSIAVSNIASQTATASRVAGMHFFNPAPVMKLVEIIRAQQTDESVVKALYNFAKALGKTPVVCTDVPGFIVNRVARHYYLEALLLLEAGLADVTTIDTLMESIGFKMGPFKLMDLIGIDVNYAVSTIVWDALGKPVRLTPSVLQKQKLSLNELGRKTGKGFYDYMHNTHDTQI